MTDSTQPVYDALGRRHAVAIAALAGATLFCQIALTRLFSVVEYYHGAFLAISLALFGFAASGVYVSLRPEHFRRERLDAALSRTMLAFAISVPVCFFFYLYLGVAAAGASLGVALPSWLVSGLEYLLLATPFFASGVGISLLLRHGFERANRLYGYDLAASALGAVLVIPALAWVGGPKSMLLATAAVAAAAIPLGRASGSRGLGPAVVAGVAVLALLSVSSAALNSFQLRKKAYSVAVDAIRWNSFSMVGVSKPHPVSVQLPDQKDVARFRGRSIVIDNSVVTEMIGFNGNLESVQALRYDWNAAAHQLRPDANVLIIGAGGGRDVLVSLVHGARRVEAVEVNPLVAGLADETFGDFTGHVYSHPRVEKVVGDARSYIANSDEKRDIILASLIDTWAASAAGAFALTENLLYTQDAFRDYYDHLTDDGLLSIARWHPLDTPRLLATGLAAWQDAGVENPREHAVIILSEPRFGARISILLMNKRPFRSDEIAAIKAFAKATDRIVALTPDEVNDPVVALSLETLLNGAENPWRGVDIHPATDERPFFFNMVRPSVQLRRMLGLEEEVTLGDFDVNLVATRTLVQLLGVVSLLLVVTVLLPLAAAGGRLRGSSRAPLLGYFVCLGLGYILIEIGLVQRLILLLGKPVYSLSVILSTMLLSSGIGSFVGQRFSRPELARRLPWLLAGASALLFVYAIGLPVGIRALLGSPFPLRLAAAIVTVAVPGFLLGLPFPCALRALGEQEGQELIPWVWGVNGAMSVVASVGGVILAIEFGYVAVFLVGASCYGVAALLVPAWLTPTVVADARQ